MIGLNTTLLAFSPGFSILLVPAVVFSAGLYHALHQSGAAKYLRADKVTRWFGNIQYVKIAISRVFERLYG